MDHRSLVLEEFRVDIYNSLTDVITAESALKGKKDHILTFAKMAEDVAAAGATELFGLTLLHRHNDVPPGQRMEEDLDADDFAAALRMQLEASPAPDAVPISWKVRKSAAGYSLVPLEFSRRAFAFGLYEKAMAHPAAIERLCERIWKGGLADIVGISLLRFDEIGSPDHVLVETESAETVANVVRAIPRAEVDLSETVVTNWRFVEEGSGTAPTAGCNPDVICVKDYDGRHKKEPRHWTMG